MNKQGLIGLDLTVDVLHKLVPVVLLVLVVLVGELVFGPNNTIWINIKNKHYTKQWKKKTKLKVKKKIYIYMF